MSRPIVFVLSIILCILCILYLVSCLFYFIVIRLANNEKIQNQFKYQPVEKLLVQSPYVVFSTSNLGARLKFSEDSTGE